MAEGVPSEGTLSPQEPVGPPYVEQERSSVKNALTKTAKTLFPVAGLLRSWLREDLAQVYGESGAKKVRTTVTAIGGFADIGRMAAVAGMAISAANADSTRSIITFSVGAAALALGPTLLFNSRK